MPATELLNTTRDEARVEELLGRVSDRVGQVPAAYRTLATNQAYLNDTLYNLKKVMVDGALDLRTKHLLAVAVAAVAGSEALVEAQVLEARAGGASDDEVSEALAVAGSISTYNVFYKFQHMAGREYGELRPGFKLGVFLRPAVLTVKQVEIICVVVSTVNDCSSCLSGHLGKSRELGTTLPEIEEALRVGALVAGMAVFVKAG